VRGRSSPSSKATCLVPRPLAIMHSKQEHPSMQSSVRTVLVTGGAGFIGSHVAQALLERGDRVVALDNLNSYYGPGRKRANLEEVHTGATGSGLTFVQGDIRDRQLVGRLFDEHAFDTVVHLAAMAGVRASIDDPALYFDVNLAGTLVLLDGAVGRLGG